jgi:hypothetical protein
MARVISRLIAAWNARGQWRREHGEAFARAAERDHDGITQFQRDLLAAVVHLLPPRSFRTELHQDGTKYMVARLPAADAELFVYANEAGIHGAALHRVFEEWDFRTPSELIAAVRSSLEAKRAT